MLNIFNSIPSKRIILLFCFAVFVCSFFSVKAQKPQVENLYKKRLLGDKALSDGFYDTAMNYYRRYLKNAENDSPELKDAYFCLIATCLKAGNIDRAKQFLKEVTAKKNSFTNDPWIERELQYWKGEIMLAGGMTENAEKQFESISVDHKKNKELFLKIKSGEGIAALRLKDWDTAADCFNIILKMSGDGKQKERSLQQLILIYLASDNLKAAEKILKDKQTGEDEKTSLTAALLKIYILVKNNEFKEAEAVYDKVKDKGTKKDLLWYIVLTKFGEKYFQKNEYKKALEKYRQAFKLASGSYEKEMSAVFNLNTLIKLKKYKEAADSAKLFLDFFPNTTLRDKILLVYVDLLLKENRASSQVLSTVQKYYEFKDDPDKIQVDIALRFGQVLYKLDQFEDALRYFGYVYKNGHNRQKQGEGLFWQGKVYAKLKKNKLAVETFKKIEEIPEWREKALYELSLVYIGEKDYDKAESLLQDLISKFSESSLYPSSLFLYAEVLNKNGKLDNAIKEYELFIKELPENSLVPKAYYNAGDLCLKLGYFDKAVKLYKIALDNYKNTNIAPEILYKLLYSYYLSDKYEQAVAVVDDLKEKYPDNNLSKQALFWLVDYYLDNKKYDRALKELIYIETKNANDKELLNEALYKKADILFLTGNYQKSLDSLNKIKQESEFFPDFFRKYFLEGDIYSELFKFRQAIDAYSKILNNDKASSELKIAAQGRIGDCYFAEINHSQNETEVITKAIKAYKKLLSDNNISDFIKVQTNYRLGKCYELFGERQKAVNFYHEALYENIIDLQEGADADKEWIAKAGLALVNLILQEDSKKAATSAISVYETLIKNDIEPKIAFKEKILELEKKYKIEE